MSTAPAAKVTIYTTAYCPYCFAAKRLLDKKSVRYTEIRCDDRPDLRSWLIETSGRQTVPQIFVNATAIGGYDDMAALDKQGRLDPLLATAPSADAKPLPG